MFYSVLLFFFSLHRGKKRRTRSFCAARSKAEAIEIGQIDGGADAPTVVSAFVVSPGQADEEAFAISTTLHYGLYRKS